MKRNKKDLMLNEPNLYKAFMLLVWPVFLSNLLKSLHDLVDTYFIGQMPNSTSAQAAISIAWPLINIFLALSTGLAVAGVAIISQYIGMKNIEKARKNSAMLLSLAIIIGLIINASLFIFAPIVMRLMGAKDDILELAIIYLRIRSFEMTFLFIFTAFQAIRQANGDTTSPVIISSAAVFVNIFLTAYCVRVLNLGIAGAALATMVSQAIQAPFCIIILFRVKDKEMRLHLSDMKFKLDDMRKLYDIAIPSAASQALSSLGFLILQATILDFGKNVAAAFSIGNKISNLLLIPTAALGSILAAFIGQSVGAGNKERARNAYKVSRNIGLFISITGCLIIYPFRKEMLSLLTNDSLTLSISMEYIFWVLLTQPLMSMFQNFLGLFNGSGNTGLSFRMSTARLWVIRLPLIECFKHFTNLDRNGIWYAMVISNILILIYGAFLAKRVDYEPKVAK